MTGRRHAGLNVPLFSLRSRDSWGIGELSDVATVSIWLEQAAIDRLLLLPLGTMTRGETSPYSALSTLAIDPLFLRVESIPEVAALGGRRLLSASSARALDEARASSSIRHDLVAVAKSEALRLAFDRFVDVEWRPGTARAAACAEFGRREAVWLDDYALFLALAGEAGTESWRDWAAPLRDRDPGALADARERLSRQVLEQQYYQWLADAEWHAARRAARARGVTVYGDLPFVASPNSPEVWAHVDEFDLTCSVGVPPDAFSPTGQDWGLPLYRWDVIRARDCGWIRARAARMARLYDGLRIDHVIGIYRTYARRPTGEAFFSPSEEADQIAQGEAVMAALGESGLALVAEDLGVIPDFVRTSLRRLGIPGCKVLRWERDWHAPGAPFLDPAAFDAVSVAMTGTHDTEPVSAWWTDLGEPDRQALLALPGLDGLDKAGSGQAWGEALRDALLAVAYRAGSAELFVPVQDVFGWADRINVPGTVAPTNWTWALPQPVDRLPGDPAAIERAAFLRRLAKVSGRLTPARP